MSELLKSLCRLSFSFPVTGSLPKGFTNVLKVEQNNCIVQLLSQNFLLRISKDSKSLSSYYTYQAL
jgi:hypothetical protein